MSPDGPRAIVLTGGPHPFAETTPIVVGHLEAAGYRTAVVDDPDEAAARLDHEPPELWVCNTLRWRMLAPKYDDLRSEFAYSTSDAVRRSFDSYVRHGGRLLAMHAAPICFDDWPEWADIVGARWDWDRSSHPALGPITVRPVASHPLVDGLEDFEVFDEAYGNMDLTPDVVALAVSNWGDTDHPMLWAREVGEGSVVTCTLGHGRESLENPAHRRILRRAIEFLGKGHDRATAASSGSGHARVPDGERR